MHCAWPEDMGSSTENSFLHTSCPWQDDPENYYTHVHNSSKDETLSLTMLRLQLSPQLAHDRNCIRLTTPRCQQRAAINLWVLMSNQCILVCRTQRLKGRLVTGWQHAGVWVLPLCAHHDACAASCCFVIWRIIASACRTAGHMLHAHVRPVCWTTRQAYWLQAAWFQGSRSITRLDYAIGVWTIQLSNAVY